MKRQAWAVASIRKIICFLKNNYIFFNMLYIKLNNKIVKKILQVTCIYENTNLYKYIFEMS